MGEVCGLVATAKKKFPNCRLVLSGVWRPGDVAGGGLGHLRVDTTGW
jgi:hypothetical protein